MHICLNAHSLFSFALLYSFQSIGLVHSEFHWHCIAYLETHLWVAFIAHHFSTQMTMTCYVFLLGRTLGNQGRERGHFCLIKKENGKTIWAVYLTENPKGVRGMQIMQNITHTIAHMKMVLIKSIV